MSQFKLNIAIVFSVLLASCSTSLINYQKADSLKENTELSQLVKIEESPLQEPTAPAEVKVAAAEKEKSNSNQVSTAKKGRAREKVQTKTKLAKDSPVLEKPPLPIVRQPEIESSVGFAGRRPIVDPFRPGEEVVHSVKYFEATAGHLTFSVQPFVQVNGKKNYNFRTSLKTSSFFSNFYAVDDHVTTYVDYEELVPTIYKLTVKESSQIKEAQLLFDHQQLKATYWEKKFTEKEGATQQKQSWSILPYSQNVFSAIFYMRTFFWDVGVENAFRIGNDEDNIVFKGKAIRREKIKTAAGEFSALVIKPEFTLKGKFNPDGAIFIWISDDERKLVLRIEAKIKIGTLVTEAVSIKP